MSRRADFNVGSQTERRAPWRRVAALAGLLVALATLLPGLTVPAQAIGEGPEATFAADIVDADGSPTPLVDGRYTIRSGFLYYYRLSMGCPGATSPDGHCGKGVADLTLPKQFAIQSSRLAIPNGVTVDSGESGDNTTVKVTWADLSQAQNVIRLPFVFSKDAQFDDYDGKLVEMTAQASATKETGRGSGTRSFDKMTFPVVQRVRKLPSGNLVMRDFSPSSSVNVNETAPVVGDMDIVNLTNADADLSFASPGRSSLGGYAGRIYDAFDLKKVSVFAPAGKELKGSVTFICGAGGSQKVDFTAPDSGADVNVPGSCMDVTGYKVVYQGVPSGAHVKLSPSFELRKTLRGTDDPLVTSQTGSSKFLDDATLVATVQPENSSSSPLSFNRSISVNPLVPSVSVNQKWTTQSGDQKSVYGRDEASTSVVRFSNSGPVDLKSIKISVPGTDYYGRRGESFNYEGLTGRPAVTFPRNATKATVTYYRYVGGRLVADSPLVFHDGDPMPDPSPALDFSQVAGMDVVFEAGGVSTALPAGCSLEGTESCAGSLFLPMKLRKERLDDGRPIKPSYAERTYVTNVAEASAVSTTDIKTSGMKSSQTLYLDKPGYFVSTPSKAIGEPKVSYPAAGINAAGDLWNRDADYAHQDYGEHEIMLSASSWQNDSKAPADGPEYFVMDDPFRFDSTPDLSQLKDSFYNFARFTQLNGFTNGEEGAICKSDDTDIATDESLKVWVVDRVDGARTLTLKDYDSSIPLDSIVGVRITLKPRSQSYYPANIRCSVKVGKVKWRETAITDGAAGAPGRAVNPDNYPAPNEDYDDPDPHYPGLTRKRNYFSVTTETNANVNIPWNTANDQMLLVDRPMARAFKRIPEKANRGSYEQQDGGTDFIVGGMVEGADKALRVVDGDPQGTIYRGLHDEGRSGGTPDDKGQSFDFLRLIGLNTFNVGPDQKVTVRLLDKGGRLIKTGKIEIPQDGVSDDDLETIGSKDYEKVWKTPRSVTWDGSGPSADELDRTAQFEAVLTRLSDPGKALPKSAQLVFHVNARLRRNYAIHPQYGKVLGTSDGSRRQDPALDTSADAALKNEFAGLEQAYVNRARVDAQAVGSDDYRNLAVVKHSYRVWQQPDELQLETKIDWSNPKNLLVATQRTKSTMTMSVANVTRSSVDNGGSSKTDVGMSVNKTSVGVGITTPGRVAPNDMKANPFQMVDFTGISDMLYPKLANVEATPQNPNADKADATIELFRWDSGTSSVVAVDPMEVSAGTAARDINLPAGLDPSTVVGIKVSFHKKDFLILSRFGSAGRNPGGISIDTELRDQVRVSSAGYIFQEQRNNPSDPNEVWPDPPYELAGTGAIGINGPYDCSAGDFHGHPCRNGAGQRLTAPVHSSVSVTGEDKEESNRPDCSPSIPRDCSTINLQHTTYKVGTKSNAGSPSRSRDSIMSLAESDKPRITSTIETTNTGNAGADELQLSTLAPPNNNSGSDTAVWDIDTEPTDPNNYAMDTNSFFDVNDLVGLSVRLPVSSYAYMSLRTDEKPGSIGSGKWTSWFRVPSGRVSAPAGIDFADVTGIRLKVFGGSEENHQRIPADARATITLTSILREKLRTNSRIDAPYGEAEKELTDANGDVTDRWWEIPLHATSAIIVGNKGPSDTMQGRDVSDSDSMQVIKLGHTTPQAFKFVGSYDPANNTGKKSVSQFPGDYVNFYLVLANNSKTDSATLYRPSIRDNIPGQLIYNARLWEIVSQPDRLKSVIPDVKMDADASRKVTAITWTWGRSDAYLLPGERIIIRLPLQVGPGISSIQKNEMSIAADGSRAGLSTETVQTECTRDYRGPDKCRSDASVETQGQANTAVEKYVNAGDFGDVMTNGAKCDISNRMTWGQGKWDKFPCIRRATPGEELTYRLKITNSGSVAVDEFRAVDELPYTNDVGTVLDGQRGSTVTPVYVPGSAKVLSGQEAEALGAVKDLKSTVEYSSNPNPCALLDAKAGDNTMKCESSALTWTESEPAMGVSSMRFVVKSADGSKGAFAPGAYVVAEFKVKVPSDAKTDDDQEIINTAAVSGGINASWGSAVESQPSQVRLGSGSYTVNLGIRPDSAVAAWHVPGAAFKVGYRCDGFTDKSGTLEIGPFNGVDESHSARVDDIPLGSVCKVTGMDYVPDGYAGRPSFYGHATADTPAKGYGYEVGDPVTVGVVKDEDDRSTRGASDGPDIQQAAADSVEQKGTLDFAATGLNVTKKVDDQTGTIDRNRRFSFKSSCSLGSHKGSESAFDLADGESKDLGRLPVGADCSVEETDAKGATEVLPQIDATLGTDKTVRKIKADTKIKPKSGGFEVGNLGPVDHPGEGHRLDVVNRFERGGDIRIIKKVKVNTGSTPAGRYVVDLSCKVGGEDVPLTDAQKRHVFDMAAGQDTDSYTVAGLPVGTICQAVESDHGGAKTNSVEDTQGDPADGKVTVSADKSQDVTLTSEYVRSLPLTIEKQVRTNKGTTPAATFVAELSCTVDGESVPLQGSDSRHVFQFPEGDSKEASQSYEVRDLPEGTVCRIVETDHGGSTKNSVIGTAADGSLALSTEQENKVVLVSEYERADPLVVEKEIRGDVPSYDRYLSELSCRVGGETLPLSQADSRHLFEFTGGQTKQSYEVKYLPVGAVCGVSVRRDVSGGDVVSESISGLDADGKVTMQSEGDQKVTSVTVFKKKEVPGTVSHKPGKPTEPGRPTEAKPAGGHDPLGRTGSVVTGFVALATALMAGGLLLVRKRTARAVGRHMR